MISFEVNSFHPSLRVVHYSNEKKARDLILAMSIHVQ